MADHGEGFEVDDQTARTRLEQLVKRRRLSTTEFVRAFNQTAAELALMSPKREKIEVSWGQARRWINGELVTLPHPISCRVLEKMFAEFNVSAEALFGPPMLDETASIQSSHPLPQQHSASTLRRVGPVSQDEIEEVTNMAAAESAAFGEYAEQSNVGPHTLEQFEEDLRRIVKVYPNRPIYPLFVELRSLTNRLFRLLEGRQPPGRTRELYAIAGTLCAVQANACFDLGNLDAAKTQARTAFLCGELAEHNALRAWVRGLQALIAYWDDNYDVAADMAEQGWGFVPETGTARVRLASIEARARARLHDVRGTEAALAKAEWARERVAGHDDPGGMMAFPIAKQAYSAASAHLWLGGDAHYAKAEHLAEESLQLYTADPLEERRLGEMSLARLDLAVARLARRDLDGAAEQIREVLRTGGQRRVESVGRRLLQFRTQLERPYFQTSALATSMRDLIVDSPVTSTRALGAGSSS
ncbi:hypothetical protein [Nocardia sp. NPDC049149]|uniref:hypothetical protein n=1 Tax=Nocardia sp. NPDC049149 TaxID=3364315 RepID=UPI00371F1FAC